MVQDPPKLPGSNQVEEGTPRPVNGPPGADNLKAEAAFGDIVAENRGVESTGAGMVAGIAENMVEDMPVDTAEQERSLPDPFPPIS